MKRNRLLVFFLLFFANNLFAEDIPSSIVRPFNFAIGLYKQEIYDGAIEEFEDFLKKYPETAISDDALFWLAMAYWRNNNIEKAIQNFNDYLDKYPAEKYTEYTISYLGLIYFENNMIDSGIKTMNVLLDKFPDNTIVADALFNSGVKLYNDNRFDIALNIFDILARVKADKNFMSKVKYYEGLAYLKKKDYDKADIKLKEILDLKPEDTIIFASGMFLRGEIEYNKGNYKKALEYYEKILQDFGDVSSVIPGVYYSLGWTYSQLKEYRRGADYFLRLFKEFPQDKNTPHSLFRASNLLLQLGEMDESIKILEELIVRYEESSLLSEAYYTLGYLYYNKGDYLTAKNIFLKLYSISKNIDKENEKRALYMLGESFYKLRNYNTTIQYTSLYLDKYSNEPMLLSKVLMTRAWAYKELEDYEPALKDYQTIINIDATTTKTEAIFRMGEIYYNKKNWDKAKEYFTDLINNYKDSEFVEHSYFARGLCYLKLKMFKESIADFLKLIELYPDSEHRDDAYMDIGWAYFRTEQYENAILYFDKVSDKNENYLQAVYQIGECYFNIKNYDTAIEFYHKVIALDPNTPLSDDASYGIGISYLHKKSFDRGIAILENFINKFPESDLVENVRMVLGDHFASLNNTDSAIYHYNKIISSKKVERLKEETFLKLGQMYQQKNDIQKAVGYYDSVISLNSTLKSKAILLKGLLYKNLGKLNEAISQFRMIVEHRIDEALMQRCYYELGYLYSNLSEWEIAKKYYIKAIELDGYYKADAYLGLGMVYYILENFDTAINNYISAIDYGNEDVGSRAQFWLGQTYYAMQKFDRAIKEFLKIFILYKESGNADYALLRIAESYQMLNDYVKAKDYYERVIKEYPDSNYANEARERIKWLDQVGKDLKRLETGGKKR
ncbi:MAG: tetratricopeptide repeat protein [Candidatus Hydrogenedentota bacterium]